MAVSKKRKKAKKGIQLAPKNNNAYIKEIARKLPLHETLMYNNLIEEGIGYVIVSRKKPNGDFIAGFYLIDIFCLGIKDTFSALMTHDEYEEHKMHLADDEDNYYISKDANYIFNLIYGAADYAEDLGFKPEKDFAVSEFILDDVENITFVDIPFGSDGRPFYIEGLNDKSGTILNTLKKNVGEGNFDFVLRSEMDDEEE
jgi:hypothetical protein